MNSRTATGTFVFVTLLAVSLCQACALPQPGKCSSDSYTIDSNEVSELYAGNCDFTQSSGLCCYQQGCVDPGMTNWTLAPNGKGSVRAEQLTYPDCGGEYYYSVLESPWLNITHASCLKFTYRRTHPAALDIFLEARDGHIKTVFNRSQNVDQNQRHEEQRTMGPGTVKILFRAYGGGGANESVNIFKVSVDRGWCIWPEHLSVTSEPNNVTQGTSPLLSPTEPGTVDCLQFSYQLSTNAGSRLTVSVQPLGDNTTVTVWRDDIAIGQNMSGQCPLQVHAPYKIIFEEVRPGSSAQMSVTDIKFSRSVRRNGCLLSPSGAITNDSNTVVTSSAASQPPSTEQCPSQPSPSSGSTGTAISSSATASSSPQSTHGGPAHTAAPSPTQEDQKESDVAAIGGGVAAAVIVIIIIAVVIIVIIVHRRRRSKKDGDKGMTMAGDTERGNGTATAAEQRDSDDYSQIRASNFAPSMPQEISSYPDLDGATSHPQHADVDPYELIQDDAPGKTRPSSGEDDYNHIGISARVTSHEVVDDDYHHIHSPHQAIPEPEDSYVYYPEHDTENNAAQPVLGYTYTQVNKQRGGDRTMEVDPDSSNVYTKANKKAKQKPGLAPKPSQPKGEGDPYNRIHRSSHPEQRGQNISEEDDVDDEYNRLNFEDCTDGVVKPSGAAIGSYDHLRDAPDAYSKADGGKRHIVIDSGYDHLHLADV